MISDEPTVHQCAELPTEMTTCATCAVNSKEHQNIFAAINNNTQFRHNVIKKRTSTPNRRNGRKLRNNTISVSKHREAAFSTCSSCNFVPFTNASTKEHNQSVGCNDEGHLTREFLNDAQLDHREQRAMTHWRHGEPGANKKMQIVLRIILRIMLPLANGVVRGIRGFREARIVSLFQSIASSRQILTNFIAFAANTISMNLSSVQVSHRIEVLYNFIKIPKRRNDLDNLPNVPFAAATIENLQSTAPYSPLIRVPKGLLPPLPFKTAITEQEALKCCSLNILAEPPADQPIRADIVFIHGLHGSLVNTWKQGLWEKERYPIKFTRPPRPPVRPPKRSRHSRTTVSDPPHKHKRQRLSDSDLFKPSLVELDDARCSFDLCLTDDDNSLTFVCRDSENVALRDGSDSSLSKFRLRINDNGLQAELEPSTSDKHLENAHSPNDEHCFVSGPSGGSYSKCWPGDWLPLDCPGVRVIALNYTTDQYLWRPIWKNKEPRTSLIQRAREMANLLIEHQVGQEHPIIWVGHSKGGLFIKQIIVDAWESERTAMTSLWRSSKGCFFYSVPHRGSHLASIKAPLLARSIELIEIEKNNKYLLDLDRRFAGLYHLGHLKVEIFSFVEMAMTLMSVLYVRIVGIDSADPGIGDVCGIRLDHREICKPRSRNCILYKELVKMINKVC